MSYKLYKYLFINKYFCILKIILMLTRDDYYFYYIYYYYNCFYLYKLKYNNRKIEEYHEFFIDKKIFRIL